MIDEASLRQLGALIPTPARPMQEIDARARALRRRQRSKRRTAGAAAALAVLSVVAAPRLVGSRSRPAEVAAGTVGFGTPAPWGDPTCLGSSRRAEGSEADGLRYLIASPPGFRLSMAFASTTTWEPECFQWVNRLVLARTAGATTIDSVLTVGEGTLRGVDVGCDDVKPPQECVTLGETRARVLMGEGGNLTVVSWTRADGIAVRVTAMGASRDEAQRLAAKVVATSSFPDVALAELPGYVRLWSLPADRPALPMVQTHWMANYVAADARRQVTVEVMRRPLPELATAIVGPFERVTVHGREAVLGMDGKGGARSISWQDAPGIDVRISLAGGPDRDLLTAAAESLRPVSPDDPRLLGAAGPPR